MKYCYHLPSVITSYSSVHRKSLHSFNYLFGLGVTSLYGIIDTPQLNHVRLREVRIVLHSKRKKTWFSKEHTSNPHCLVLFIQIAEGYLYDDLLDDTKKMPTNLFAHATPATHTASFAILILDLAFILQLACLQLPFKLRATSSSMSHKAIAFA